MVKITDMKKIILSFALCLIAIAGSAATRNYLCAITELSVDTLKSNTKNQFTLQWMQTCKNTAEYNKPTTTYTTTVKLVLNSDDRTLEGTYTTEGADPDHASSNVNDQTINLVTSELYYGSTRRLLRSDSISTFTIIKIDDTHYGISVGRLCFTAAALADRGKDTYNYHYCYAAEQILEQGIEPTPYVFGYESGYHQQVYNYDMSVTGIDVEHSDTDFGAKRYFLTLNCTGACAETGAAHNYEVQLAIYPTEESIVGSFATQGSSTILMATYSYVKDNNAGKLRYLCNDSLSTVKIASKGENLYSFYGGTLTCVDLDANYSAVYGKKRVEAVNYYHFSDNAGEGIPFGWDETSTDVALTPTKVAVNPLTEGDEPVGYQLTVSAKVESGIQYEVFLDIESSDLDGTFSTGEGSLTLWSKVSHGSSESYVTNGAIATITPKTGNTHTLTANLICENGYTYQLQAFDFNYGEEVVTGVSDQQSAISGQQSAVSNQKVLRGGQLLIIREGKIFNTQGTELR